MKEDLTTLRKTVFETLQKITDSKQLDDYWLSVFGKNGLFTKISKNIKTVPQENRAEMGILLNKTKKEIDAGFESKKKTIIQSQHTDWFDVTIPGTRPTLGHLHPQTYALRTLVDIFTYLGYQVADGPEIESDWYNFGSLNFPDNHPARDTQQSLHIETPNASKTDKTILRTQTSAMQVRVMEKMPPPFRVIVPGKTYRYDAVDASHGFEFWQLEGFAVDKNITLTDLFGTIDYVLKQLMGPETKLRFACTNFPFVEPGVDTYMECTVCHGKGCAFCKQSGWSEIMPAGMIHPNVLKAAKIDSLKWQGFAFCIGLSRAVTLRYGMDDLRLLTTLDTRILNQF